MTDTLAPVVSDTDPPIAIGDTYERVGDDGGAWEVTAETTFGFTMNRDPESWTVTSAALRDPSKWTRTRVL